MVDYNGTPTFTYDAWGRTISKTRGGKTATYGWGHNHKITSVDSDFPDEGDVDYRYGGDGKRRERDEEDGTDITWYNWDGYTVINEEADGTGLGDGALTRTYVGDLADIAGSNPATGTARYYTHDHLGSTRGVFNASKTSLGTFEFTPYGSPYHFNGPADLTHLFTGHDLDPLTGNYYAPFRYLNPGAGRWMNQDPLGMINGPNMYGYVGGNPINYYDPDGRLGIIGAAIGAALIMLAAAAYAINSGWRSGSRARGANDRRAVDAGKNPFFDANSKPYPPGPRPGCHVPSYWDGYSNPDVDPATGALGPGDFR